MLVVVGTKNKDDDVTPICFFVAEEMAGGVSGENDMVVGRVLRREW